MFDFIFKCDIICRRTLKRIEIQSKLVCHPAFRLIHSFITEETILGGKIYRLKRGSILEKIRKGNFIWKRTWKFKNDDKWLGITLDC